MDLSTLWHKTQRTKPTLNSSLDDSNQDGQRTPLRRCLTTTDIILLGIGHMIGSGAYVITSSVARNIAGPAIVLSYIISGAAAFLCALCYAEFAARYPKCGSAYSYTYIALGEVWAFIVGWNMVLENVIGIAAVSRACSAYLDSTIGGEVRNITNVALGTVLGTNIASHLDLMAGMLVLGFALFLTFGMGVTTVVNNAFSLVNIVAIGIIIIVGGYYSDISNWHEPASKGGFMPYGWRGVFAGSASCFYAYVGFDSIATSGEEAKNPQRSIPIATFVAMACATASYVGVSLVLTLMVPYTSIAEESGLPDALGAHGATWAKLAVIVGACAGMATVLIGTIYSLTRIVYAMSDDGLLFPWMSVVHQKSQIPLQAMFFFTTFGILAAIMIDITALVEMMSIGTLIAYLVVSASIIVVRYRKSPAEIVLFNKNELSEPEPKPNGNGINNKNDTSQTDNDDDEHGDGTGDGTDEQDKLLPDGMDEQAESSATERMKRNVWCSLRHAFSDVWNRKQLVSYLDRYFQDSVVSFCVGVLVVLSALICLTFKLFDKNVDERFVTFLISLQTTLFVVVVSLITTHEQNIDHDLRYKVPGVPWIPVLSIFFNVALIVNLNWLTWMRFVIWMTIGFSIYFLYGIQHSKVSYNPELTLKINSGPVKNWGSLEEGDDNKADNEIP